VRAALTASARLSTADGVCGAIGILASLLFPARTAARAALLLAALTACAPGSGRDTELVLATTTSTDDSGLLDELLPAFEAAHPGVRVRLIAVGSGQALALGRRGDADVMLVHSPDDEAAFMHDGAGRSRLPVMYNDYVIAGPAHDPAGVRSAQSGVDAFRRIARHNAPFVSRGDDSGTHRRELALWREADVDVAREAFRAEVGQGMGEALAIAAERRAYVLSDRATFTALAAALGLSLLHEGGATLQNPYSVVTVAGARQPEAADAFAAWMTSPAAAALIRGYGVERFGAPVFTPSGQSSLPD
jgi:tungstate transport system substrate-binding protein